MFKLNTNNPIKFNSEVRPIREREEIVISDMDLIYAATCNNVRKLEYFLVNECNIDVQNAFGFTPLHAAIMAGNFEAAQFLIDNGANVTIRCYEGVLDANGFTPIDMAFCTDSIDIINLFVQKDVVSAIDLQNVMTALTRLASSVYLTCVDDNVDLILLSEKLATLENFSNLTNTGFIYLASLDQLNYEYCPLSVYLRDIATKVTNPEANRALLNAAIMLDVHFDSELYLSSKLLSHIFHIDGLFDQPFVDKEGNFNAEGWGRIFPTRAAYVFLREYIEHTNNEGSEAFEYAIKPFTVIQDSLFSLGLTSTSDKLFESYTEGTPLVLPTGWDGHAVEVILSQNHDILIMSNSGQRYGKLGSGVNIFKINLPGNITSDAIYDILNNTEQFTLEAELSIRLGLEHLGHISLENQSVGNCAWVSPKGATAGLLYLYALEQDYTHEEAIEFSIEQYAPWNTFITQNYIEYYLNSDMPIPEDMLPILLTSYINETGIDTYDILMDDSAGQLLVSAYNELALAEAKGEIISLFDVFNESYQHEIFDNIDSLAPSIEINTKQHDVLNSTSLINIDNCLLTSATPLPDIEVGHNNLDF